MSNKIRALIELIAAGLLGAGIMIGLKILSPNHGEQIFWVIWLTLFMYFAYTFKVSLLELQDLIKRFNKENQ